LCRNHIAAIGGFRSDVDLVWVSCSPCPQGISHNSLVIECCMGKIKGKIYFANSNSTLKIYEFKNGSRD